MAGYINPIGLPSKKRFREAIEKVDGDIGGNEGIELCAMGAADLQVDLVNVVTPHIVPMDAVGWYHPHHNQDFVPVKFNVFITQSRLAPAYQGLGTLTVNAGVNLFRDAACAVALQDAVSIAELTNSLTLFARAPATLAAELQLTLTNSVDLLIQVMGPALQSVRFQSFNVISPRIHCDQLVLVHGAYHNRPTDASRLNLSIDQTDPTRQCHDLHLELRFGEGIACFRDLACTNAQRVAIGTTFAADVLPASLYMRGIAEGQSDVRAALFGSPGPAWRLADNASQTVLVEKLELEAALYAAGLSSINLDSLLVAPKRRELHAKDARIFTPAQMTVRSPTDAFWQKADQVLLQHDNLDIFSDENGNNAGTDLLVQGNFGVPVLRFFATQALPAWDGAFAPGAPARHPDKMVSDEYVSCGARIQAGASADGLALTLRYGDVVRLDAFSFDQYLDRITGNECGVRITGPQGPENTDVALARAGAHHYYDLLSTYQVNRNYAVGLGPFNGFIRSMNNRHGNTDTWSLAAANWIGEFLLNQHAIILHVTMQTRIRNYIRNVLLGPAVNNEGYGFDRLYGVPGVHAECLAINDLLNRQPGLTLSDLTVATYMLQVQPGRQGGRFVACPNCRGILLSAGGPRVITG